MNSKTMVASLAFGSLLFVAAVPATQVARAESDTAMSGPASGMVGGHEDCHMTMAAMMRMMHQHHGMMGDGAGMMGDGAGMMGASPVPEAATVPPNTAPDAATLTPSASLEAGHEQHHPSASPAASPSPW